jgi:hypothetical protein
VNAETPDIIAALVRELESTPLMWEPDTCVHCGEPVFLGDDGVLRHDNARELIPCRDYRNVATV